jgi:hypothetical protein
MMRIRGLAPSVPECRRRLAAACPFLQRGSIALPNGTPRIAADRHGEQFVNAQGPVRRFDGPDERRRKRMANGSKAPWFGMTVQT